MVWLPSNIWFLSKISVRCCCFYVSLKPYTAGSGYLTISGCWKLIPPVGPWVPWEMSGIIWDVYSKCPWPQWWPHTLESLHAEWFKQRIMRLVDSVTYCCKNAVFVEGTAPQLETAPLHHSIRVLYHGADFMGQTPPWMHEISHELELKQLCILNFPDDSQWNLTYCSSGESSYFYKG